MTETETVPFHIGLTPTRVIETAVELTRDSHLFTWSIRDLAGRLGVAPSVVYHHVGGKDLLCRRVVEQVLSRLALPPTEPDWQEWFRRLLYSAREVVAPYPGIAKWMLMHGPTVPVVMPILEAGMSALHRAGFGERSAFAYAALFNNAMLTVSLGDDRLQHEGDGPRDHATMMAEFHRMPAASEGVGEMGDRLIRAFAEGGESASLVREAYYRFVVDTTIAGLAASLQTERGHSS